MSIGITNTATVSSQATMVYKLLLMRKRTIYYHLDLSKHLDEGWKARIVTSLQLPVTLGTET
uniref:Uncharacterized protein n=1 Tax=Onchocerca volvulus TaxID=6282 RepID=A0A8R1Y680_ONCVO